MKERLELAKKLAIKAGHLIVQMANEGIDSYLKEDQTIVTKADLAADKLIREGITKAFPKDGILTEEISILKKSSNDFTWVIDPIDGTKAYARNISGYSVMIALLQETTPVLGVIYEPLEDWLYYATLKGGAFGVDHTKKAIPLHVSSLSKPSQMTLIISPSMKKGLGEKLSLVTGLKIGEAINSVGVKVVRLIRQFGDVYFGHHPISYWDSAAPMLIAQEAGATATFLDGSPFTYELNPPWKHPQQYLVTNSQIHEDIRLKIQNAINPNSK
jgi:3'(2'), 5'-bisphosphate nucleotidase